MILPSRVTCKKQYLWKDKSYFNKNYFNLQNKKYESNNKNMYKEDSSYTLVEAIEELGFIPSIHKTDEDKAA